MTTLGNSQKLGPYTYHEWLSVMMAVSDNPVATWKRCISFHAPSSHMRFRRMHYEGTLVPPAEWVKHYVPGLHIDVLPDHVLGCVQILKPESEDKYLKRFGRSCKLETLNSTNIEYLLHRIVFWDDCMGSTIDGCPNLNCFNPFHTHVRRGPLLRR